MINHTGNNRIGNCPVCGEELVVSRLECEHCHTIIEGKFSRCDFCNLPQEQLDFTKVFLDCRGNIREVEKKLGISYPTVRNRLEEVRLSLGFSSKEEKERDDEVKREILEALSFGEITPQEALKRIENSRRK